MKLSRIVILVLIGLLAFSVANSAEFYHKVMELQGRINDLQSEIESLKTENVKLLREVTKLRIEAYNLAVEKEALSKEREVLNEQIINLKRELTKPPLLSAVEIVYKAPQNIIYERFYNITLYSLKTNYKLTITDITLYPKDDGRVILFTTVPFGEGYKLYRSYRSVLEAKGKGEGTILKFQVFVDGEYTTDIELEKGKKVTVFFVNDS